MELVIELIKSIVFGIVQGITEWLPISSTGHLILLEEFLSLSDEDFFDMFKVVIQFGSILAVAVVYFSKLFPIKKADSGKLVFDRNTLTLWIKVIIGCIPAGIAGVLLDDLIDDVLSEWFIIAGTLIFLRHCLYNH